MRASQKGGKVVDFVGLLKNRHYLKKFTRDFFTQRDYCEVDTPVVVKCPGTEVHLQYFETAWRDHNSQDNPRFLRSSPELHMKRLIAQGADRIFQLGPSFRNHGELSDWHNPEFFMLEWYQRGQTYLGLIDETEQYLRYTADKMYKITGIASKDVLPEKFDRIRVEEAFLEFANIKLQDLDPNLASVARDNGVVSVQADDDFETSFFKILIEKIEPALMRLGGCVLYDYPPSQAALAAVGTNGWAQRFEIYLGRVEICNGFFELTGGVENKIRISEALEKRRIAGYSRVPVDAEFLNDMAKFSLPFAGNALGFDRWLALLQGWKNLEASIAFIGV